MNWLQYPFVILAVVTTITAINRPVYKVVLTQKGYTQFLQYDLETPPLREFTFCSWIRTYDLGADQSIFTYVANGNSRILRLWLDSGGHLLKLSVGGQLTQIPVNIVKDVWRHICLTYQSDYGAWAVYVDAKLVLCECSQKLYNFVLPDGGSVIIGYGPTDEDNPSGFEGEMFGANMLLVSTIEKNHSISIDEHYHEMKFKKNQVKGGEQAIKYVVFGDLQTDEIHNNFEKTVKPPFLNKSKSFIKINTLHSSISHEVGLDQARTKPKAFDLSNDKEFSDFQSSNELKTEKNKNSYWETINAARFIDQSNPNKMVTVGNELSSSSTKDLAMISEYETPPPPPPSVPTNSLFVINNKFKNDNKNFFRKKATDMLLNLETPPPPQKDNKVYGQWTSSKFAGTVLDYLKSINYQNRDKKVPVTIPLLKISDSYPYASDFKVTKIRPPSQFQRKSFMDHRIRLHKRGINKLPEINVKIIETDLRSDILKMHAVTEPKNVVVTNRGEPQKISDQRFYRNVDGQINSAERYDSAEDRHKPRPFSTAVNRIKQKKVSSDLGINKNHDFMTILPFLKSLEYFVEDQHYKSQVKDNVQRSSDMYSKSLANGNKWHNIKTYNNDYTPRRIHVDPNDGRNDVGYKIPEPSKIHPTLRLNYKHEGSKDDLENEPNMVNARELAKGVSKQSSLNKESISIIKYNHGYLPSHESNAKPSKKINNSVKGRTKFNLDSTKRNFDKQVKLGNALNERHVIGDNDEQKKKSFVGGNEQVPDIHRYRSDIDSENANVPPSLKPKTCRNKNFESRPLYIQEDESILVSHIESPVRKKNIAVQFIHLNYKHCSLEGSNFERSHLLFIDWRKTPVRLFGGAQPRKTTDLCGFF